MQVVSFRFMWGDPPKISEFNTTTQLNQTEITPFTNSLVADLCMMYLRMKARTHPPNMVMLFTVMDSELGMFQLSVIQSGSSKSNRFPSHLENTPARNRAIFKAKVKTADQYLRHRFKICSCILWNNDCM